MANKLPPVPHHAVIADQNGILSTVWADWFKQLFSRAGGNIAPSNGEAIPTSQLTDLSVTTAKLADASVDGVKLKSDASVDSNRPVSANHMKDGIVSLAKLLSTDWTRSLGTNGYQKLPSGLYIQWGQTGSIASLTNSTVSFPVAFPSACFSVIAGVLSNSAGASTDTGHWGTSSYSTSSFSLNNRTTTAYSFSWMAVGN